MFYFNENNGTNIFSDDNNVFSSQMILNPMSLMTQFYPQQQNQDDSDRLHNYLAACLVNWCCSQSALHYKCICN